MSIVLNNQLRIGGKWCHSESGREFEIRSPADLREVVHSYPSASAEEVGRAVLSASDAQKHWARVPIAEKAQIMREAARLMRESRDDIAALITRENGKLISESHTEIHSTLLELEFQVGEGERQYGRINDSHLTDAWGMTRNEPLGVVSVIVPWNFPFNVPFRKLVPALMAGNTAVLKPASQTAGVGEMVVQLLTEAGLPKDVLQFVTGSGGELSAALVASPAVRAVTFTGSTPVGKSIARQAADGLVRTQLEMGGKNPAVVLDCADLDLAAEQILLGGYSCAGQWCTATSRVIATDAIYDALLDRLLVGAKKITVGTGDVSGASMGPVCGEEQLKNVLWHIERAKEQDAMQLLGGGRNSEDNLEHGCFINPTIFQVVAGDPDIRTQEVFGPVIAVERANNYEDALQRANAVPYGLSSTVFTRDLDKALDFAERSEVGMTHVNMHSAFKEPQFGFGGVKESGFGLPEAGSTGIQFFQEEKNGLH